MDTIKQLLSKQQIDNRIAELGCQISGDFHGLHHPVVIGVMKGSLMFMADLLRQLQVEGPLQIEFVRLSSYGSETDSSGVIKTPYLDLPDLENRHVLVVEDIIDSGRTAKFFLNYLQQKFHPATLRLAAFLSKPSRRVVEIEPDYVGFTIEDLFVVGYGLDYAEKYRELAYLGELSSTK